MAYVTDSNRPQPLWQPPPTACLTASGPASEVPSLLMQPWEGGEGPSSSWVSAVRRRACPSGRQKPRVVALQSLRAHPRAPPGHATAGDAPCTAPPRAPAPGGRCMALPLCLPPCGQAMAWSALSQALPGLKFAGAGAAAHSVIPKTVTLPTTNDVGSVPQGPVPGGMARGVLKGGDEPDQIFFFCFCCFFPRWPLWFCFWFARVGRLSRCPQALLLPLSLPRRRRRCCTFSHSHDRDVERVLPTTADVRSAPHGPGGSGSPSTTQRRCTAHPETAGEASRGGGSTTVNNCYVLSATVNNCQQLSTTVSNCQQRSTTVNNCQQLSAAVSNWQQLSATVNNCHQLSTTVNNCQQPSTTVNNCQQLSATVNNCQQLSATVNNCQQLSTSVNNCQQVSTTVSNCQQLGTTVINCQQLSATVKKCQQLSATVNNCQQLSATVIKCQQLSSTVSNRQQPLTTVNNC